MSPDSEEFRYLKTKGYLVKRKGSDQPAILDWWNGSSACYDLSNPDAYNHLRSTLKKMQQDYHIDGFKFDADFAVSQLKPEWTVTPDITPHIRDK